MTSSPGQDPAATTVVCYPEPEQTISTFRSLSSIGGAPDTRGRHRNRDRSRTDVHPRAHHLDARRDRQRRSRGNPHHRIRDGPGVWAGRVVSVRTRSARRRLRRTPIRSGSRGSRPGVSRHVPSRPVDVPSSRSRLRSGPPSTPRPGAGAAERGSGRPPSRSAHEVRPSRRHPLTRHAPVRSRPPRSIGGRRDRGCRAGARSTRAGGLWQSPSQSPRHRPA